MPPRADDEITRAQRAQSLLANPLLVEAIQDVKARATATFQNSRPDEVEKREEAYQEYRAICQIENYLTKMVQTGKMRERMNDMRGREGFGGPAGIA